MTQTYRELINGRHTNKVNATDAKSFYSYEMKQYKRLYLQYMNEIASKKHNEYTTRYLKGFTEYCRHFVRYYATRLAEIKKEQAIKTQILGR